VTQLMNGYVKMKSDSCY